MLVCGRGVHRPIGEQERRRASKLGLAVDEEERLGGDLIARLECEAGDAMRKCAEVDHIDVARLWLVKHDVYESIAAELKTLLETRREPR